MSSSGRQAPARRNGRFLLLATLCSLVLWGCSGGDGSDGTVGEEGPPGNEGPPGDPGNPGEEPLYECPGLHVEITAISGGSGGGGNFRAGDTISVTFTAKDDAENDLDVPGMSRGSIFVSGPSSNYQRVIASQSDVRTRAVWNGDGTWTYAFANPVPATYLAPLNDTASFGAADGELQGQPLLAGTYTVGMQLRKDYTFEEGTEEDVGVATADFLFGAAAAIERRAVVSNANCNACHEEIQAHGGNYRDVGLCVLCHTAGAEDKNVPTAAGGTPGTTIDFRVMIHKIHNGAHLPSVLGVTTLPGGTRDYAAAPKPLEYVGYNDTVADFSHVSFPVWPSLSIAMPRDRGYSALSNGWKTTDDTIRKGAMTCAKCHGDPDGAAGPLPAPAQGNLAFTHPSRQACGSCHDDVVWENLYMANDKTMPSNLSNATCISCHEETGDSIAVRTAHTHPLLDPAINPGLNFNVLSLEEAASDDGNIDPGERIRIRFTVTDDAGVPVSPADLASISAVMSGPTTNYNLLQSISIPNTHPAFSTGAGDPPVYTMILPRNVVFEWVGTSTASPTDAFPTALAPHLNVTGSGTNTTSALTTVLYRFGADGAPTTTAAAAGFQATWLDVAAIPAGLAKDDYLVLEDAVPARKEFVKVSLIDGLRIWLTSPLRYAHAALADVKEVPLVARTNTPTVLWTLDAPTGTITEVLGGLGTANDVIVSYTTEYVMPSVYPPPLVDTPDLGVAEGEWMGLPIASGTYTLNLYGYVNRVVALYGETQTYRGTSPGVWTQFLVGDAVTVENYQVVSSGDNCYACHDSIWFHGGGRRGFETCVLCHATSAPEDRPSTTAPTPRVSVSFREMLHKVHMAEELPDAATYPFEAETGFPAMPGGVKDCVKCHGNDTWTAPHDRAHPAPGSPHARNWTFACASCHNTAPAQAHFDIQSPGDMESCEICHGADRDESVAEVHETR